MAAVGLPAVWPDLGSRLDGALHGAATWGVAALLSVFIRTTMVGSLIGGAFGVVANVLQIADATNAAPLTQIIAGR